MRYYAERIAKTELHRATMAKRAKEYIEDDEVEFVRFEMSSSHPKVDICDYYANLDVGYGRGIIPKNEMRTLPLHPHCLCVYSPYYGKVKKKKIKGDPYRKVLDGFSDYEKRQILGSYDKLERFKRGKHPEEIFNEIRPKYPIRKYVDIISRKFKENYLQHSKTGYFDEEFEELSIDEICKRIDIDKKDVDEIIKKTKFEVEGAVYYKNNGDRVFVRGGKDYVEVPFGSYIEKFIHSHPKGTSFSAEDILMAINNKTNHIIAFNDEYFYSLKLDRFDFDFDKMFLSALSKYDKILQDKVQRSEIITEQKDFVINHKVWKDIFEKIEGVKYDYFRVRR